MSQWKIYPFIEKKIRSHVYEKLVLSGSVLVIVLYHFHWGGIRIRSNLNRHRARHPDWSFWKGIRINLGCAASFPKKKQVLNFKFQTCRVPVPYILLRPAFSGNLDQLVTAAPGGSKSTSRAEEEFSDAELENLVALSQIQQVGVFSYRICFSGSGFTIQRFLSIYFLEENRMEIFQNWKILHFTLPLCYAMHISLLTVWIRNFKRFKTIPVVLIFLPWPISKFFL